MPLMASCYLKVTFPDEIKINVDETLATVTGDGFMLGTNIISQTFAYGLGNYVILEGCPTLSSGYQ